MKVRRAMIAAVVVLVAGATMLILWDDPEGVMCSAEGLIDTDGELLGRSTSHDCQFVDDDGDVLTTLPDGEPLCYDQDMFILSCTAPDARRPG